MVLLRLRAYLNLGLIRTSINMTLAVYTFFFVLVTCVSFSKDDTDVFVMGAEGGGVFKCSIESSSITSKGTHVVHSLFNVKN